jgi:hypothetical protein
MGKINTVQISGISYSIEDSEATKAVTGKQDTLISGTNIKTINNESILGSGNIDIQGGGGTTYTAGTNIDITNDVISCTLNASNGDGAYSFREGWATYANKRCAHAEGDNTMASGAWAHAEGAFTTANADYSHTEGYMTNANNKYEHASGIYNVSTSASTTFGDSGNTLFSVGNGISTSARHNAFEIRQNGDIYLTKNGQNVKLQDQLDGYVTTNTEQTISGRKIFTYSSSSGKAIEFKQTNDSAKVGFRIINSASTNNELASFELRPNTFTIDGVQHPLLYFGHYRNKNTGNAGVPQTVIGYRQYDQLNAAAYHYLIPLPEKAKTPFNLTTSFKDYYAPMGFKNGSTMITADDTGVVDLSSEFSGKQDTLSAGTGIEISGNVISATGGGGGGGKAIEAGRGISVTTGETADTVSFNLPISAGTGMNSLVIASNNYNLSNRATTDGAVALNGTNYHPTYARGVNSLAEGEDTYAIGESSHAEGHATSALTYYSHAEGDHTTAGKNTGASYNWTNGCHAEGYYTKALGSYSHTEGYSTNANNQSEHASGQFNNSVSGSSTFGDSGNTLFSVGNGTSTSARHNAFEIRQNGDIYITLNDQDVKLQDQLGGGGSSYTAGDGIDITNDVISVTGKADTSAVTEVSDALTAHTADTTIHVTSTEKATWNAKSDFSGSYNDLTNKLSAGTNITIVDNVISAEGGGGKAVSGGTNISVTTGETADTINCTLRAANTSGTGSMKLAAYGNTNATGVYSVATGFDCKAKGNYSFASGRGNNTNNYGECAVGFNNKSVGTSDSISKNSGCTLFSVGNGQGTSTSSLHNAFEVRQNGDIYITLNDQDVKLQDQLGGGGSSYSAGTGIDITNDVISVSGVVMSSAITTSVTSSSTDVQVPSAKAVNDKLGGLSIVKLTQSEYDGLATKDNSTLYVIVN